MRLTRVRILRYFREPYRPFRSGRCDGFRPSKNRTDGRYILCTSPSPPVSALHQSKYGQSRNAESKHRLSAAGNFVSVAVSRDESRVSYARTIDRKRHWLERIHTAARPYKGRYASRPLMSISLWISQINILVASETPFGTHSG